jgi:predicted permease
MRWATYVDGFRQDISCGTRQLGAEPGFTCIAVLTLALGIGTATAIYSVLRAVVLRPLAFHNPGRIAFVGENYDNLGPISVSVANFVDWRRKSEDLFEHLAAVDSENLNLSDVHEPERVPGARVSREYFDLLGMPPLHGRWFLPEEDRPGSERVVILSYRLWVRRYAADPTVIGHEIRLNGIPHTTVGVMPQDFSYPAYDQELWVPIAFTPEQESSRNTHYLDVFGRLRPGVSYEAAQARLDVIGEEQRKLYPNDSFGIRVVPYAEWLVQGYRHRALILMAAGALLLLTACINVANLLLARGASRLREMAIRTALGAGMSRIARQILTEVSLLAFIAAVLGTTFAFWITRALIAWAPESVPRLEETRIDLLVLGFMLVVALAAGLCSGLLPAVYAARAQIGTSWRSPRWRNPFATMGMLYPGIHPGRPGPRTSHGSSAPGPKQLRTGPC